MWKIIKLVIVVVAVATISHGGYNTITSPTSCYFLLNCAPDKPFHPVTCSNVCKTPEGAKAVPLTRMFVENHGWSVESCSPNPRVYRETVFYKSWLEFNDQGTAWSLDQKLAILNQIAEFRKEQHPLYIVIFVHGWHHNADDSESSCDPDRAKRDAVKFNYFMARQADQLRRLMEQRGSREMAKVLGIFVGWRGDSITTPGLSYLTIGNRAAAADRLASDRSAKSLFAMLKEVNLAMLDADPNGQMLVVGHSLGGRVLSRMLIDDIVGGVPQPLGKNTQIVALEAAVGADCFDRALGPKASPRPRADKPTFISISSEHDTAIRRIYPPGSTFLIDDCSTESKARGVTIGSHDNYLTHTLTFNHVGKVSLVKQTHPTRPGAPDSSPAFPPAGSNKNWFQLVADRPLAYTMYDLEDCRRKNISRCYNGDDVDFYTMAFKVEDNIFKAGQIWNIRTDRNTINFLLGGDNLDATHNGYVSTNLARLMVELQYPHLLKRPGAR